MDLNKWAAIAQITQAILVVVSLGIWARNNSRKAFYYIINVE